MLADFRPPSILFLTCLLSLPTSAWLRCKQVEEDKKPKSAGKAKAAPKKDAAKKEGAADGQSLVRNQTSETCS